MILSTSSTSSSFLLFFYTFRKTYFFPPALYAEWPNNKLPRIMQKIFCLQLKASRLLMPASPRHLFFYKNFFCRIFPRINKADVLFGTAFNAIIILKIFDHIHRLILNDLPPNSGESHGTNPLGEKF